MEKVEAYLRQFLNLALHCSRQLHAQAALPARERVRVTYKRGDSLSKNENAKALCSSETFAFSCAFVTK